jgi:tRNA wybutosine-synthesizing protein 1
MIEKIKKELEKKHYKIFNHSGVQICEWTKKSIRGQDVCYKEKFYGIHCHRCMQFSPTVAHCNFNCVFCWRPNEFMYKKILEKINEPEQIVKVLIELRKQLLSGFGGSAPDMEKFKEALEPNHFAISLAGEPTLYPKIVELVEYSTKIARTTFLVTNGTRPEILEKIKPKPNFQLYISLNAPNKEKFFEICKPAEKEEWENFNRSLEVMRDFKGRKVIRLTLIKNLNLSERYLDSYLNLINKASPDFLEVKAFMNLGHSRRRLGDEYMPSFGEIKEFAKRIDELSDYKIENWKESSRVVLLKNQNSKMRNLF